ncbi:hypothetical protein [Thiorhodovibrio frisius]|uniref:Uncharacterized protein n=1 Tax=Thiorhodovibrio frisius TaxID=631362 RepID=H8YVZ9_9GAMM|nr:hypothetical protein [Thiorhodovibrio frisius]EIC23790.1 hypothetical protein Thi970DRAFT_00301 [Thiorhodovibrio frisius]WPL23201.1 hypothetical protein Thiofri_03384 [Thiorhodovibrio frisius]
MSDTETPKRRGRPSTGKALTSAERMRRVREKARLAFDSEETPDLSQLPDSALLDYLRQAYQARMTWHMASAAKELFQRANARGARYPLRPSFERIEPEADIPATVTKKESTTGGDDSPAIPATVAENKPEASPTLSDKPRGYPTEVKRLAVRLTDEGKETKAIRAAILEACGKAPDISNLARLVRQWRASILKAETD